jgi:hypothetical protein
VRPATQAEADAFARHMCARFHARLIRKDMAVEMQLLAAVLDALRTFGVQVPVGGDFLNHYATSLGPLIYMPPGWSPDTQIEVLTHEVQHVHQFWGGQNQVGLGGGFHMGWLYLTEGEARLRYEVDAYRAGLEVAFARMGRLPALDSVVFPLEGGYALSPDQVGHARDLLEIAGTSIAQGLRTTEAGRVAVEWLQRNAPELLP